MGRELNQVQKISRQILSYSEELEQSHARETPYFQDSLSWLVRLESLVHSTLKKPVNTTSTKPLSGLAERLAALKNVESLVSQAKIKSHLKQSIQAVPASALAPFFKRHIKRAP